MLTVDNLSAEAAALAKVLPPFPRVVMQLLEMLRADDMSVDALTRLARNDPVISSGILATANRLRRINAQPDIHDPFIAASLIGVNQVRRIVVAAAMNKFAKDEKGAEFLYDHSHAVAIVAY
jgi:HD-like signal output (HDOD) protein